MMPPSVAEALAERTLKQPTSNGPEVERKVLPGPTGPMVQ